MENRDMSQNIALKGGNQTPFIKLYRSPNSYYFFDVIRNKICEVNRTVYYNLNFPTFLTLKHFWRACEHLELGI